MYLSIVQPDFSRVNVARALINEQDMHRNIQAMFSLDRQTANVLYRTIPSKRYASLCDLRAKRHNSEGYGGY